MARPEPSDPGDRGLTLIELVVAMAVFALVAVMGLQSLTGMMRLRERLGGMADDTARLATGLSLLRADLDAALPMVFFPPDGSLPRSALMFGPEAGAPVFEITVGGLPAPEGPDRPGGGIGRVEWRLDPAAGTLARREWLALTPARADARMPETVVLTGVTGIALRSHWPMRGWIAGVSGNQFDTRPAGDGDAAPVRSSYSSDLPDAVEVTLITRDHGRISLLESLK
ncbi:hypothetical protein ATO6_23670 [Oceanicola sp. 22II-s10i]|uniref:type II secretion system protein GspJ n=1 Tax=Oceanicola sp. 22II-s10i TaxID=1317116 RepID=UPI000B524801|nr:type II secretion system protein GspJ [Oceanicola sp. 22II-s10i]OWU81684.1 hypothetical protein ATO6_23670 [Oceanicola sp. 22II-s10i]